MGRALSLASRAMVKYRAGFPPLIVMSRSDSTRVEVFKRADGRWQWTAKRGGRKVGWEGQGNYRCRAIDQAVKVVGGWSEAEIIEAVADRRGKLRPAA